MAFCVDLDIFRGPLDLLLYLVRKHEVEAAEIPVAPIAKQFLEHLDVLKELDIGGAADFLEMASTLIEIKSRIVLPRGGEVEEELDDPKQQLVQKLLEYKKFKDAASMLEERGRAWQERYPRLTSDRGRSDGGEPALQPIHEVELWDLVSAFGRVMRENAAAQPSSIVYDDTPIHVYMARIHVQLVEQGRVALTALFKPGMHKSTLVGIFLAILELVRHHGVRTEQDELFGEIWVLPNPDGHTFGDVAAADGYSAAVGEAT